MVWTPRINFGSTMVRPGRGPNYFLRRTRDAGGAFSPSDIAGLTLWLAAGGTLWQDSARTTPATSDGDPVGAWDDASGNASHAIQATSGNRPTLQTSEINSLPCIRFDGTDDSLTSPASAALKPGSAFAVVKRTTDVDGDAIFGSSANGGIEWRFDSGDTATILKQDFAVIGTSSSTTAAGAYTLVAFTYDGSGNWAHRKDSAGAGSGTNSQTLVASTIVIGRHGGGSSESFDIADMDLAELIVYDSAISGADLTNVEAYLTTKYGL